MEEEREGLLLSDQCEGTALTSSQGRQPESFLHITREHQLYTQHCLQHLLSLFPVCACVCVCVCACVSGPLPVPSAWLTQASCLDGPCPPPTAADPHWLKGSPFHLHLEGQRERTLGPGSPRPSKKHMVTMPFQSLQNIPLSSFLPSFSPADERKTARGLGREGHSAGLSQCHPRRPTEPGLAWDEYPRYLGGTP